MQPERGGAREVGRVTKCYRMQEKGIAFEAMLAWNSRDWGTMEMNEGLAACDSPDALRWLAREWYGHNLPTDQEVVEFDAELVRDIGDGWLVSPLRELDRIDLAEFVGDYEQAFS